MLKTVITLLCGALVAGAASAQTKVNIGFSPAADFTPVFAAKDKGFFEKRGLDVTLTRIPLASNIPAAIVSDSLQIGMGTGSMLVQTAEAGLGLVALNGASRFQKSNSIVSLVARTGEKIQKPEDFKGKKVGVWGDEWEFYALMAKAGLDPQKDLTLVQQAFTMDAFLNKELDVASATLWNEYNVVLESGVKESDLNVINYTDFGVGIPHGGIVTTEDYLKNNRDVAVKFLKASDKGWLDAYKDQKGAVDIVMKVVEGGTEQSARDHQERMLKAMQTLQLPEGFAEKDFGKPNPEFYSTAAQIAKDYKLVKKPVDVEAGYDLSVWQDATK
jgi:NitT/TauT family transport system substrate-binding protein